MVNEDVIITKLEQVNQYTNELKQMRGVSRKEYLDDFVFQRAVERSLMNVIQSCIDLAAHIRADNSHTSAETSRDEIDALVQAEILTEPTGKKLEEAVGFRNLLAHRYGEIDHDVVYDVLQDDLQWFEQFQQEVAQWLQTERE